MKLEDAIYELLGVPHAEQPADAHRLLGIARDESNPEVIRNAAARQVLFLRQVSTGKFADIATDLIQRLTEARRALLSRDRRQGSDLPLGISGEDCDSLVGGSASRFVTGPPRREVASLSVVDSECRNASSADRLGDTEYAMGRREWVVGADSQCDLVVRSRYASRRHCRVWETEGLFWVEDLGSRNGTHINEKRIDGRQLVRESDVITLGARTRMPWPPTMTRGNKAKQAVRLITIGRSNANDIVLRDRSVSRVHAQICISSDHTTLQDCGSTNGTYVGDRSERIESCRVAESDIIRLGKFRLRVGQLIKDEPNR